MTLREYEGRVLSGYRHDLVWMPRSGFAGHLRAIVWAAILAGALVGLGL